jgi:hypothetical protein
MAASRPNLLTLPRELRDRVYFYLTHQLDFNWDRSEIFTLRDADGDEQLIEPVPIRVLNCPLTQVLCVHPSIYEEYHTVCMKNLEAIVDPALLMLDKSCFSPHWLSKDSSDAVLARLRHVTLFITLHAKTTSHNLDWQNHLNLLRALTTRADALSTVRIAVRQQYHMDSPTFDELRMPTVLIPAAERLIDAESHPFLPHMPSTLNDMPLVQRGEGYHIGYAPTYLGNRALKSTISLSTTRTYTIDSCAYSLSHAIRKIGVYMYCRDGDHYGKHLWTVKGVVERWPMRKYPKEAIESVSEDRGVVLARVPFELTEWIEMTGVENVKRWV